MLTVLVTFFPFLAIPFALISFDFARRAKRKKKGSQWFFFFWSFLLVLLTVLWVVNRGDIHSAKWASEWFR